MSAGLGGLDIKLRKLMLVGLAAACLYEQSARVAEIEGVRFLDQLSVDASELRLQSTG